MIYGDGGVWLQDIVEGSGRRLNHEIGGSTFGQNMETVGIEPTSAIAYEWLLRA